MNFSINVIDQKSPYLKLVKELWYPHRSTLGFLPDGAFNDYAKFKQILVTLDERKTCIAYLIYRISGAKVILVHLCVHPSYRKMGLAKHLINHLSQLTKSYLGIGLRCRRDYKASKIWPNLGFTPRHDKPGKSYDGKPLTFWWLDHGHPSLFTVDQQDTIQSNIVTALDANVFFDLQDADDPDSVESKSLLADWLPDNLILVVTEEIFNEINRSTDLEEIQIRRRFVETFSLLRSSTDEFQSKMNSLRPLFPDQLTIQDESDLRQLSRAIAGGAQFFVTRDAALLELSETIFEKYCINIIRPCDLIVHFDELIKKAQYQPVRLAGSLIHMNLVKSGQDTLLTSTFQNFAQKEKKVGFLRKVRNFLANPNFFETWMITDSKNSPVGLIVYSKQEANKLGIPLFRVIKNSLSSTLARHLVSRSVFISSQEGRILTEVIDKYINDDVADALSDCHFFKQTDGWVKCNLAGNHDSSELLLLLEQLESKYPHHKYYLNNLSEVLKGAVTSQNLYTMVNIERSLWPVKITDANIPTFIVPIKPEWAAELFDEGLASQSLFGAKPELALSHENVYYRAKYPRVLSGPSRVLWYVSRKKDWIGSMSIRACSYVDNLIIGIPKELFIQFRRLGVYSWTDVLGIANADYNKEIMAVCFSNTEVFKRPIQWEILKRILAQMEGRMAPIQSPMRISNETFNYIYNLCSSNDKEVI